MTYAILESGGKQYKVSPGNVIEVEQLAVEQGSTIELDRVLLVADDSGVTVGRPTVADARVRATVVAQDKAEKVIVFKYKPKVRYRRKIGHRQPHTRLVIDEIVVGSGGEAHGTQKSRRQHPSGTGQRRKKTGSKTL